MSQRDTFSPGTGGGTDGDLDDTDTDTDEDTTTATADAADRETQPSPTGDTAATGDSATAPPDVTDPTGATSTGATSGPDTTDTTDTTTSRTRPAGGPAGMQLSSGDQQQGDTAADPTGEQAQAPPTADGTLSERPRRATGADVTQSDAPTQQQTTRPTGADRYGLETVGSGLDKQRAQRLQSRVITQNEQITSPTQVRIVREGDQYQAELTQGGREQLAAEQLNRRFSTDEFGPTDVETTGQGLRLTESGIQERRSAAETQLEETQIGSGRTSPVVSSGPTPTSVGSLLTADDARDAGSTRVTRTSGSAPSGSVAGAERGLAAEQLEQQLESEYDTDFEEDDYEVRRTGSGFQAELTESGIDKLPPGATSDPGETEGLSLLGRTLTEGDVTQGVSNVAALGLASVPVPGVAGAVSPDEVDTESEEPVELPAGEREFLSGVFGEDNAAREAESSVANVDVGTAASRTAFAVGNQLFGAEVGGRAAVATRQALSDEQADRQLLPDGEKEALDAAFGDLDDTLQEDGPEFLREGMVEGRAVEGKTVGGSPFAYAPVGPTSALSAFGTASATVSGGTASGTVGGGATSGAGSAAASAVSQSTQLARLLGPAGAATAAASEFSLPSRDPEVSPEAPQSRQPEVREGERARGDGELPVQRPGSTRPEAGVPADSTVRDSELSVPDATRRRPATEIRLSPQLLGRQTRAEEEAEDDRAGDQQSVVTREDLVDEPTGQLPPEERREQIGEQLRRQQEEFDPEYPRGRQFPTGEDAVVGRETPDNVDHQQAVDRLLPFDEPSLDVEVGRTLATRRSLAGGGDALFGVVGARDVTRPRGRADVRARERDRAGERSVSRPGVDDTVLERERTRQLSEGVLAQQLQQQAAVPQQVFDSTQATKVGERTSTVNLNEKRTAFGVGAFGFGLGRRLPRPSPGSGGDSDGGEQAGRGARRTDLVDFAEPLSGSVLQTTPGLSFGDDGGSDG